MVESTGPSSVPDTQPITSSPLAPPDAPSKGSSQPSQSISDTGPHSRRSSSGSTPIDPSQLNHSPAPIPIPSGSSAPDSDATSVGGLRSPENPLDSAYLDSGGEPSSHPTVAETGSLVRGTSMDEGSGPGPKSGQLERKEKKLGHGIIKLGSFGGEGLIAKPAPGLKMGEEEAVE